jgi:hypothetical protein
MDVEIRKPDIARRLPTARPCGSPETVVSNHLSARNV